MTPKFAEIIRADAERESLNVRVIQRDVFSTSDDLRRDYRLILLSEVVSDFRSPHQLRAVFELATQCLAAEGRPKSGYTPDSAALELGQQCYTTIFTDEQVREGEPASRSVAADQLIRGLVSGRDVFDLPREDSPIEMHWLVYQKPAW
jgi:hypothetical protein